LLEVGSVSVRNTQNILFKNILSPTIAAILFWSVGYSIAYGNDCDGTTGAFMGSMCYWFMADGANHIFKTVNDDGTYNAIDSSTVKGGITDVLGNCTQFPSQSECVGVGMSGYHGSWYAGWFFQWAFCATASTIVSGAVAERVAFKVYIIITIFLTGFIYPVVVHWGWASDGWACAWRDSGERLFGVGVIDFAGSGIVHMVGGVAALVAAYMVGPRHGRFVRHYTLPDGKIADCDGKTYARCQDQPLVEHTDQVWMEIKASKDNASGEEWCEVPKDVQLALQKADEEENSLPAPKWKSNPFPCQSSTFQTFGCLILWFGWYGFNGASTLALEGGSSMLAAKVMVNTTMAAASGALTVGLMYHLIDGLQDLGAMSNGILAGLVSITSACSTVEPWAAIVCGIVGGAVYYCAVLLLEKLRIDDVVLAIPVHCFCGIWGVIAAGLFSSPMSTFASYGKTADGGLTCGLFYGETDDCSHGGDQLAAQVVFVLAIIGWVGGTTFVVLLLTKQATPLAYDRVWQMYGMDVMKHGGRASPENKTVHDEPTIATAAPGDPKPRKRRSSVVGQTIIPAPHTVAGDAVPTTAAEPAAELVPKADPEADPPADPPVSA
jgi:ammonia channel protein AmtB